MNTIWSTSVAILFCNSLIAQGFFVKGIMIDSLTKEPIPFAAIQLKNTEIGTTSNVEGNFELEIPFDRRHDTLFISCLNYQTKAIPADQLKEKDNLIALFPISYELAEVVVQGKPKRTERLGVYSKQSSSQFSPWIGHQIAVFIPNHDKSKGQLKKVGIYLTDWGKPNAPFRIRIYNMGQDSFPDQDILKESLVIKAEKKGWFWYDISSYDVYFPENGAFIAMELVFTDKKYYWHHWFGEGEKREKRTRYGSTIGLTKKTDDSWTFFKRTSWKKSFINPSLNAMIAAEVDFFD
ncbi:MAG: carboxypeptidase-like regulatory domain-containing protein [Saprospiraceae bacterium]|nr:carboxypeptidase-like regulatory domain-containing protein [Saprospiraceae bacterium]